MIVGPPPERPVVLALGFLDGKIVDARDPAPHQAVLGEFPVLVAVRAEPAAGVVAPLVGEAHGDAVLVERPELLDQPVVELPRPLAAQELDDRRAPREELGAVPPDAVGRVGERHALGVARVPRVLGAADLLHRRAAVERRERRTALAHTTAFTRSGRNGMWRTRAPLAAKTALAIAGATMGVAICPAPVGRFGVDTSLMCSSGMSAIRGTP